MLIFMLTAMFMTASAYMFTFLFHNQSFIYIMMQRYGNRYATWLQTTLEKFNHLKKQVSRIIHVTLSIQLASPDAKATTSAS